MSWREKVRNGNETKCVYVNFFFVRWNKERYRWCYYVMWYELLLFDIYVHYLYCYLLFSSLRDLGLNLHYLYPSIHTSTDFTRLKLVQGKKEDDIPKIESKRADLKIKNDEDITAQFDAQDDADVVF